MAWKEVEPMEQRIRFVLMVQDEVENFSTACRHFEISRKTGYKWWKRYRELGLFALEERSRRPYSNPRATSAAMGKRILRLKEKKPHWGPKKIRASLRAKGSAAKVPASSTIGGILAAAGLVRRGRRRRPAGPLVARTGLSEALQPNDIWAVDFKGWFRLRNGERCEPLTVSDLFSRYILQCAGGADVSYNSARSVLEYLFQENGLPLRIRVDNGPPFGSRGAAGLSRLAVWWVSLGIEPEFIAPGHPQQNGSHERMHRTLKAEAIHPIAYRRRAQQRQFDRWRWEFNYERPHEALGQVTPASLYRKSSTAYRGPVAPDYPAGDLLRRVRTNGEINWKARKRFIGEAFIGQTLGLRPISRGTHQVYFHHHLLGEIDESQPSGMKPVVLFTEKTKQLRGQKSNGGGA